MEYPKNITGIAIRTSNDKAMVDIPKAWEKFYQENIADKIPNKVSNYVFAVYTDYESDESGPYTLFIGCETSPSNELPEGLSSIEIPTTSFKTFSAKGPFPEALQKTWGEIWNSDLKRTYTTDIEVYGPNFQQETPEVDVLIAIEG